MLGVRGVARGALGGAGRSWGTTGQCRHRGSVGPGRWRALGGAGVGLDSSGAGAVGPWALGAWLRLLFHGAYLAQLNFVKIVIQASSPWVTSLLGAKGSIFDRQGMEGPVTCPSRVTPL